MDIKYITLYSSDLENYTKKHQQLTAPMRPRAKQPEPVSPRTHSRKTLAVIQKHDTKLEQLNLNKSNPEIEFKLNSEDSFLMIHCVSVISQKNFENKWTNFISKIKLTAELKYVVFDDKQSCFNEERKNQFPIHLLVDPRQVKPVFQLNKLIKNETFTLGINPERKFYRTLKLELQDVENLDEDYSLVLNIEKFKIDD